jgi:hypothetical protein
MATHVGRLSASALVGVGAAFDFHSGTVPWAPAWIRSIGLEWVYRLAHEPRRLWRRNLDSPAFLGRVFAQRLGVAAEWRSARFCPLTSCTGGTRKCPVARNEERRRAAELAPSR